ncbi:hypothetical protein [Neobacillus drentensis]|uniref:hypothetical protein n=1 Tax=Neobacillus drentensis TaxID=220684 RepID=UPI003000453D
MIWLYIFGPVIILAGIAMFLGRKSGEIPSDGSHLTEKLQEYPPENNNIGGPTL